MEYYPLDSASNLSGNGMHPNSMLPGTSYDTHDTYGTAINDVCSQPQQYMTDGQRGQQYPANPDELTSPLSFAEPVVNPGPGVQLPAIDAELLPETLTSPVYTPGFLRANMGKLVRVESLIGNMTTDRVGYIREVGASYLLLDSVDYGSYIMCDLPSIKFVTILRGQMEQETDARFQQY